MQEHMGEQGPELPTESVQVRRQHQVAQQTVSQPCLIVHQEAEDHCDLDRQEHGDIDHDQFGDHAAETVTVSYVIPHRSSGHGHQ